MSLVLLGSSHKVAPVEVRELVAVPLTRAGELAHELAGADAEAVCLSTCNRTELYVAHEDADEAERRAEELLARLSGGADLPVYRLADAGAALHLFRVAAGLDSMVPGEGEILGQVRAAYEAGAAGPLLDRLFRQALHAGRKARAETAIAESPASVPAAAAALAQQVFDDLHGRRVIVVGAGKMSEQTARNLASRGAEIAVVANRSADRAAELAGRFGAEALPLDRIAPELERADVVVSSTSSEGFVVGPADVKARRGRPLLLVDLAVPRDLDPEIHRLEGCYLYDIDDLQAVVSETVAGRRREAVRAEAIVAEEANSFRAWQASLDVVPAIASLRARAEEIRTGELAKADGRLSHLSSAERRAVESVTAQIVNKLLHLPTVRLKEAAAAPDGAVYAETVRHLFGLGEEER